jgi:hypothetical protein
MRVLDEFFRQGWVKRLRDRRTAVALDDARLEEQKEAVRDQRAAEDYPSRGGGYIGR